MALSLSPSALYHNIVPMSKEVLSLTNEDKEEA